MDGNYLLELQDELQRWDDDSLQLLYVPVMMVAEMLWEGNPKDHDLGQIITSIKTHGFRDPPEYDATLGAFVAGNGRIEALVTMYRTGERMPLGLRKHPQHGWCVPCIFGNDAKTVAAAKAYGIANNRATERGGWNDHAVLTILKDLHAQPALSESTGFDADDIARMLIDNSRQEMQENNALAWIYHATRGGIRALLHTMVALQWSIDDLMPTLEKMDELADQDQIPAMGGFSGQMSIFQNHVREEAERLNKLWSTVDGMTIDGK